MFSKTDIETYFMAEKKESLLFLLIGLAGIITAVIFFFFCKTGFYQGAAIPPALVGLLLGMVGYTIYKRSDEDRRRNVYAYDMNPSELKQKELPRMKKVMKNFIIYRYTEIALALTGTGLFIIFFKTCTCFTGSQTAFWKGFGLTLAIMSLLALTADFFAEKRGKKYMLGIESFIRGKA